MRLRRHLVLVERTITDQYIVIATSAEDAEGFIERSLYQPRTMEMFWVRSEELEPELRYGETTEVTE